MDAPVSGGVAAATAGTLAFMCGGDTDTFEKILEHSPMLSDKFSIEEYESKLSPEEAAEVQRQYDRNRL